MPAKFQPRPPSPLHYEPLPTLPEEVFCSGSDDDETLERHRDKRRRVEDLGAQYLQGRGLVILSAGLRGPFEYGWENPWANKRPKRAPNSIREIPEEPRRAAADIIWEQRLGRQSTSGPVSNGERDVIVRAETAPPTAYRTAGERSTEQAPVQGRRGQHSCEHMNDSIMPSHAQNSTGESVNTYTSFRGADGGKAAPISDVEPISPTGWLKRVLKGRFRETPESSSPTPTPGPRIRDRTPEEPSLRARPRPTITHLARSSEVLQRHDQNATPISGFTPVNRRMPPQVLPNPTPERDSFIAKLQKASAATKDPAQASNSVVRETTLAEADDFTKKGYEEVKQLSQEAAKRAKDDDAHLEARKLSQEGALRAYRTSTESMPVVPQLKAAEAAPRKVLKALCSPHEVPPSTSLPGFEYRIARKPSPSSSRESSSFSEQLEAAKAEVKAKRPSSLTRSSSRFAGEMRVAKAKAKAHAIRRLSFTASGRLKSEGSRRSSQERPTSPTKPQQRSTLRRGESSHEEPSSEEGAYASATSKLSSVNRDASRSEALPEAQVVAVDPGGPKMPSGPLTNLLETDKQSLKFPSVDEGDSYMNLSTQAAIAKAQRSFQNDVLSPFIVSPQKHRSDSETSPTAYKTPKSALPLSLTTSKRVDGRGNMHDDDEEPISTQAMIDAMSPFAVTTVKRKPNVVRRANFARSAVTSPASPTANDFRPHSPSMSTSVSPSPSPIRRSSPPPPSLPVSLRKGPSSLTSFSIAPNGTLTEVYQHDGQQQQFVNEDGWNLEDALEEAGSFLGTWEVDAEARKVGSGEKGLSSGTSGAPGIFSSGNVRN